MAYNVHAYNYIEGPITIKTNQKYFQTHGSTYGTNHTWKIEFESIKISSLSAIVPIAKSVYNESSATATGTPGSSARGWRLQINTAGHPMFCVRNASGGTSYTFSNITIPANTWVSLKFEMSTTATASPYPITCTYNGTTQSIDDAYSYNINQTFYTIIGSANTAIRGNVIIQGYTYGANTLYTATLNPDNATVGATELASTGTVDTYTCSAIKRFADALQIKISDAWKSATPYIKISGSWKQVKAVYLKISGSWKQIM